jgi:quinoprotein glucose dehydrogenase
MVITMESMRSIVVALLLLVSVGMCLIGEIRVLAQARDHVGEWPAYASDKASSKYSPLDQINKDNVAQLQIAWRQSTIPDEARHGSTIPAPARSQNTPLMVDGLLYISTGLGSIAALDATTGAVVWSADPQRGPGAEGPRGNTTRGLAYWHDRVIAVVGPFLTAFNAKTGETVSEFGDAGVVDLRRGYDDRVVDSYTWRSAPLVVNEVIVVGSFNTDFLAAVQPATKEAPPGDVRGYDVRTGEQLWIFHTIPREGEFGNETWETNPNEDRASWEYSGHTNMWSFPSGDEELGYVYLPLTTPTNDYYGGHRWGDNLFAESLVCLNVKTGERVWHFQAVHHGLWDYDFASAPNLIDITVDGRVIKAVAIVSKQAFTYVFDRVTGEPVWPMEERPVPQSTVPGERTSPTQPFPSKPPAFDQQGVTVDDLIDFTPELREEAIKILNQYEYGPLFTPPTLIDVRPGGTQGLLQMPGTSGGANWVGAGVDLETGILYVQSAHTQTVIGIVRPENAVSDVAYIRKAYKYPQGPQGLPLFKPPYSRLVAIDLNKGEIRWTIPVGNGPRDHPAIKHLNVLPLGQAGRAAPLITKTLLFLGEGGSAGPVIPLWGGAGGKMFRAYDKATGETISEVELPGQVTAAPMTYMASGKQYVVVTVGASGTSSEYVALALP